MSRPHQQPQEPLGTPDFSSRWSLLIRLVKSAGQQSASRGGQFPGAPGKIWTIDKFPWPESSHQVLSCCKNCFEFPGLLASEIIGWPQTLQRGAFPSPPTPSQGRSDQEPEGLLFQYFEVWASVQECRGEWHSHPLSPAGELATGGCQSITGFLEMTHGKNPSEMEHVQENPVGAHTLLPSLPHNLL